MKFSNSKSAHIDLTDEVPYISFPVLSDIPFIRHGFSTKLGGVSKDIFSTMNLGSESSPYVDNPDNILENYRRISESIGIDPHSIVVSKQVHKTNIRLVDYNDRGKGLYIPRDYDEIDGLITDKPGITLVTKYADCVPLFFVDTKRKAIGLTHSGWRGTVSKIGLITVNEMKKAFGSNPEDIIAVIGPSICAECYEVGEDTAIAFLEAFPDKPDSLRAAGISDESDPDIHKILSQLPPSTPDNISSSIITRNPAGRYQCNLWEANRRVLTQAGLTPEHINISGVCTSCNSELLFSHRKTQGRRGSLAAFLTIK